MRAAMGKTADTKNDDSPVYNPDTTEEVEDITDQTVQSQEEVKDVPAVQVII